MVKLGGVGGERGWEQRGLRARHSGSFSLLQSVQTVLCLKFQTKMGLILSKYLFFLQSEGLRQK